MKKFNKIMCTALAALTIVSSSAAISSSFTGTGIGTAITADAAKSNYHLAKEKIVQYMKSCAS